MGEKSLINKKIQVEDFIKASRKGSREAEIELFGHPVSYQRIHKSKKTYDRKKIKAASNQSQSLDTNNIFFAHR